MDSFCEHLPLLVPAGQNVGKEIRYFVGVHRIEEAGGHDGGGGDLPALDVALVHHADLPGRVGVGCHMQDVSFFASDATDDGATIAEHNDAVLILVEDHLVRLDDVLNQVAQGVTICRGSQIGANSPAFVA